MIVIQPQKDWFKTRGSMPTNETHFVNCRESEAEIFAVIDTETEDILEDFNTRKEALKFCIGRGAGFRNITVTMRYVYNQDNVEPLTLEQEELVGRVLGEATMANWAPRRCVNVDETIHGHIITVETLRGLPLGSAGKPQRMDSDNALALTHMMEDCRWIEWAQDEITFGISS